MKSISAPMNKIFVPGCLILLISCHSIGQIPYSDPVGSTTRKYYDPLRKNWKTNGERPLATMIWYPADINERAVEQRIAIFKTGRYRFGAKWRDERTKYPLIVVSHGTGGSAASIAWLCVKLAAAGNIVAAVNHHGNTGAESKYLIEGFICWWERPADMRVLIDNLLADSNLCQRIDPDRIGVAGFSIGGYTALATVGARLEVERWKPYCSENPSDPICHLPPEAHFTTEELLKRMESEAVRTSLPNANKSYLDPRIKAAFVIAPVGGPLITKESLQSIQRPVQLVVGSEDDQGIPSTNAVAFAELIPDSSLEILSGVRHYTFLSEGTWLGKMFGGDFFADPEGIDRAAVHARVGQAAIEFFRSNL